ncbi:MAG: response regulator, partial [Myxococcaceae bacterium]
PVSGALRRFLEQGGFEVKVAPSVDEALAAVKGFDPEVVFTSATHALDGEALCARVKLLSPSCPVVLVYPPEEDAAEARAAAAGADACLVGPIKRGTVVSTAGAMLRIRDLRLTVARLEADLKKHVAEPPGEPVRAGAAADFDFEFFKKFLLMEVKRSRRYRYPVSFLLVAVDRFAERLAGADDARRRAVLNEVLVLLTRSVRDIDLVIPFSENRFLVFLPHTPRDGAVVVASRMHAQVARAQSLEGLTGSVGVAAYDPGRPGVQVNFGTLMKDATEALGRAQLAGGDRVEAPPPEKPKRDRISMG